MMMNRLINDRPVKRGYWAQMRSLGISLQSKEAGTIVTSDLHGRKRLDFCVERLYWQEVFTLSRGANVFLSPTSDLEQVHIDGTRLITLKFICTPNFDKISQSTAENK